MAGAAAGAAIVGLVVPAVVAPPSGPAPRDAGPGGARQGEGTAIAAQAGGELPGALPAGERPGAAVGGDTQVPAASGSSGGTTRAGASPPTATPATTRHGTNPIPAGGPPPATREVGVGEDRVKLGFVLLDVASVGRLGVNAGVDPDQQRAAFQAYVDELNAAGGFHGRLIDAAFRTYDVTSESDQQVACRGLTQDEKVFAVVGGFNLPSGTLCVTEEHATPNLTNSQIPTWLASRAAGRLATSFPISSRMMRDLAAELDAAGLLSGRKLGVVSDDQVDPRGRVADELARAVAARGGQLAHRTQLSGDLGVSASQVPVEVNQMRSAGVEIVVLVTSTAVRGTQFVQTAESQRFRPRYAVSDWGPNFTNAGARNMPSAFADALGVTVTRQAQWERGAPERPIEAACRRVYERRSGRTMAARGSNEHGITLNACDLVRLFGEAAGRAGRDLTRVQLMAAIQALGGVEMAAWGPGSFGPGKLDYADAVRLQRWSFDCRCWVPEGGFRPPRA